MVYQVIWNLVSRAKKYSEWEIQYMPAHLREPVRELGTIDQYKLMGEFVRTSKDDTFFFILQNARYPEFQKWLEEEKLKDYVVVQTKGITNPIHASVKHNLFLVVLQSLDHFQRKEKQ